MSDASGVPSDQSAPVDIRIVRGNPTPEELAALSAVVTGALDEIAGEQRRRAPRVRSAWERSQRAIRTPVTRGAWSTSER